MDLKHFKAPLTLKDDGSVEALFSVFNDLDSDQDVVLPSFFQDGQPAPMAAWGHDWDSLPPGKGVINVRSEGAVFDGRFFTDTTHGRDHYLTVKELGDLQEWSFGFRIIESKRGEFNGKPCRYLVKGETFEVSPVLVGANRSTRTLSVKGAQRKNYYSGLEAPEGSYEDLAEDIAEAFQAGGYCPPDTTCTTVATFPDGTAYVCICDWALPEPHYYRVTYSGDASSEPTITGVVEVEAAIAFQADDDPAAPEPAAVAYAGRTLRSVAVLRHLTSKRVKEGRTFSTANVERLQAIMQSCRDAMDEMEKLLGAAATPKAADPELRKAYWATEARLTALLGVAE